mmetsp:Transcript_4493/g.7984  ORF Transcript_4493/g.7984 Transcript_4493/m.7984 type:complete len:241 (+) Transcript_4493:1437-2159(+)
MVKVSRYYSGGPGHDGDEDHGGGPAGHLGRRAAQAGRRPGGRPPQVGGRSRLLPAAEGARRGGARLPGAAQPVQDGQHRHHDLQLPRAAADAGRRERACALLAEPEHGDRPALGAAAQPAEPARAGEGPVQDPPGLCGGAGERAGGGGLRAAGAAAHEPHDQLCFHARRLRAGRLLPQPDGRGHVRLCGPGRGKGRGAPGVGREQGSSSSPTAERCIWVRAAKSKDPELLNCIWQDTLWP